MDLYSNFPIGREARHLGEAAACVPGQPDWPRALVRLRLPSPRLPSLPQLSSSGGSFSSSAALVTLLVDRH